MSKLTNPSLLLLRNEDELVGQSILVVNFEQDGFLRELKALNPDAKITAFSYNHANAMYASKIAGIHAVVDHTIPNGNYDLVIYYYPKAKPEAQMSLDNIRAVCHQDAQLFVVGENKSGVKSVEKQLKDHCGFSNKIDSAKHCILYLFSELTLNDNFAISRYHKQFQVKAGDIEFTAISVPGVFNHGALDVGTAVLLNNAPTVSKGKVLDFACGAGIIATYLGLKQPELEFVCSDVSALATYATEQTLALNDLKGQAILSDGLTDINGKFDLIISNPPFHTGIATDYTIAEAFLSSAKQHLSKQGKLTIVANSFLKYPPILEAQFGQYSTDFKNTKFAVYSAK
ncbi:16S rRNA (guanine(1207)-N(2))-methyltransferase RsmC [Pseudoalteromonas shioyasakiensis]|uniref:Ribosomal RNA small subunit methyltransferase C n=1 Tax=Pseudoalteromonas shioyasakiensis TaxID=1190813 RepID=A0ABT6TZM9_9GAMM|nr:MULTISPECIES: 16S rRNA (guanine(1207)-N(2))-methyltransferase RsmC [Pseudoalteromonas]MDI4669367.1 16S rRNA (guanine(1207)-N(2))-methyltransferase RsmC [Pseudoalteromonas shioyasakiensis]MDI4672168.1 16S rRNA (guanine(1207)-N(2))-methyltransferase RsmC [Pseudoalteromonas shioyasakiensis]MDI4685937.1 16S rRNA (guanine(1207)-N(2))-methyltransferase RsmC [Pseudoalteromonas shioyasakiensis]MDI4704227.1 16S rRNA (guanine(1207)-N(2))-methyltransferase RsmC [Pseudoalteromonas shioyasakiensis]NUJ23|tara:strand:+ start:772 stop:1800 length:1029 start_codon:yes stop_codon:yes gene_type:complete